MNIVQVYSKMATESSSTENPEVIRTFMEILSYLLLTRATGISATISMFYIIGLGLADEKDVTLRGLEVLTTSL